MKTCGFCKEPCGNSWCPVKEDDDKLDNNILLSSERNISESDFQDSEYRIRDESESNV